MKISENKKPDGWKNPPSSAAGRIANIIAQGIT